MNTTAPTSRARDAYEMLVSEQEFDRRALLGDVYDLGNRSAVRSGRHQLPGQLNRPRFDAAPVQEDEHMPNEIGPELKARAVGLGLDHRAEYPRRAQPCLRSPARSECPQHGRAGGPRGGR